MSLLRLKLSLCVKGLLNVLNILLSALELIHGIFPTVLAPALKELEEKAKRLYLAKDLLDGAKNLSKLHDEFVKSEMWKYCIYIAESYNETAVGQAEYLNQNRLMTEFVLDMNYSMLYSNAFEIAD